MKILIVDDYPANLRLLRAQLEAEGHHIIEAANGLEALKELAHANVDAIISDILMPRMDGYRLCNEVRKSGRWHSVPFIFYTATYTSPSDKKLAMELGAQRFITKPAAPAELFAALSEVLRTPAQPGLGIPTTKPDTELLNEYSERLVAKLEEKNFELAQSSKALNLAHERLRHLLLLSPVVIYSLKIAAQNLVTEFVSENVESLLGFTVAEAMSPDWWREHLHPEDRERLLASWPGMTSKAQSSDEYRFQRKNGDYIWLRDEKRLSRDDGGEPVEIIGSWADITERKRLEGELMQAQKMECVGHLAGGVAHDFNNMLTVINGHSSLLLDSANLDPEVAGSLRMIFSAGERAARMTHQLLAFSRRQPPGLEVLDLNEVIAETLKLLQHLIGEDITLEAGIPSQPLCIQGDEGMIGQMLLNLAVNARDAMPRGGRLTIGANRRAISAEEALGRAQSRPGDFVCVEVRDTGAGIPPEVLPRIFEPFFTTKEPGKGTGLGLATVFGIVRQHQGWIEVESGVGAGTLFKIYLPASPREKVALGIKHDAPIPGGGNETILLVEDEAAVRELGVAVLHRYGYRVLEAGSGKEALNVWKRHAQRIDLLLTDLVMPDDMTGAELARELQGQKPSLKVIYSSGYGEDWAGEPFSLQKSARFVPKPYQPHALAKAVRESLDENDKAKRA